MLVVDRRVEAIGVPDRAVAAIAALQVVDRAVDLADPRRGEPGRLELAVDVAGEDERALTQAGRKDAEDTGGAINVVVRKPQAEAGGMVEVGYGRFDQVNARASFDLPLSATFLSKISAFYRDDHGYVKNSPTT